MKARFVQCEQCKKEIPLEPCARADIATDSDITAQRRMSAEMLKAAGLDPEELLMKAGIGNSIKDQADYLTRQLVGLMNIVKAANNVRGDDIPEMGPVSLV